MKRREKYSRRMKTQATITLSIEHLSILSVGEIKKWF